MAWKTAWAVSVDGKDASAAMNPFLTKIEVNLKEAGGGDTASLSLDDSYAEVSMPLPGAKVSIAIAGVTLFTGFTEAPEHDYSRGGGRCFEVHCVSHDTRGRAKDRQTWHQDGGTFEEFFNRAAKAAGFSSVIIDSEFAKLSRPWWSPAGATFLSLGRQFEQELGGLFRTRGDKAVFARRGSGQSAGGQALGKVVFDCAEDGGIIHVSAHPYSGGEGSGGGGRTKTKFRFFDRESGEWREGEIKIEGDDDAPPSVAEQRYSQPSTEQGEPTAKGRRDAAKHEMGGATVECDLRVDVAIGAPAEIRNDRPGVDGDYVISSGKIELDRNGGGRSTFELKRPSGKAGKDGRAKTSATTGTTTPATP